MMSHREKNEPIELLSIDLSNYCSKECSFCYNHSTKDGNTQWTPEEVLYFATDCIKHGVKAISLGGGEPFEYDGIFDVIDALSPKTYLSVTTNGLPLEDNAVWQRLICHKPDKIHLTIHKPDNMQEVYRVFKRTKAIGETGIKSGVNLLVGADNVRACQMVYTLLVKSLKPDQIILVPQRYGNTPSAQHLASVSRGCPFQSPSCLLGCKRPSRFASVSWDKKVNSCSFAHGKVQLQSLDFEGLQRALKSVKFVSCC